MKKKNTFGFTLIEILTVIMIIGILASVILVSMDTARKRAADTTIQNQIGQLRSLAEALYTFEEQYKDFIDASLSTATDDGVRFDRVRKEIQRVSGGNFELKYPTNHEEYCMYAPLVRETGKVYCVDSSGDAAVIDNGNNCDSNFSCRGTGTGSTGCDDDADCGSQYCLNPPNGTCVDCYEGAHCGMGGSCNTTTYTCE